MTISVFQPLVAAAVDTAVLGATGTLLMLLFGYLFKELRRKDEGVWAIVADRDKRILEVTTERNYWRAIAMGEDPDPLTITPHPAEIVATPTKRRRRGRTSE
jgi:hypothetical protein